MATTTIPNAYPIGAPVLLGKRQVGAGQHWTAGHTVTGYRRNGTYRVRHDASTTYVDAYPDEVQRARTSGGLTPEGWAALMNQARA